MLWPAIEQVPAPSTLASAYWPDLHRMALQQVYRSRQLPQHIHLFEQKNIVRYISNQWHSKWQKLIGQPVGVSYSLLAASLMQTYEVYWRGLPQLACAYFSSFLNWDSLLLHCFVDPWEAHSLSPCVPDYQRHRCLCLASISWSSSPLIYRVSFSNKLNYNSFYFKWLLGFWGLGRFWD